MLKKYPNLSKSKSDQVQSWIKCETCPPLGKYQECISREMYVRTCALSRKRPLALRDPCCFLILATFRPLPEREVLITFATNRNFFVSFTLSEVFFPGLTFGPYKSQFHAPSSFSWRFLTLVGSHRNRFLGSEKLFLLTVEIAN